MKHTHKADTTALMIKMLDFCRMLFSFLNEVSGKNTSKTVTKEVDEQHISKDVKSQSRSVDCAHFNVFHYYSD